MASADQAKLREVVDAVAAAAGYDVEEMTVVAAGRRRLLRVVIDSDSGVDLDDAAGVSRDISARLDELDRASEATGDVAGADPMGAAAYTLEVTSPGIGRPLTLPRHFRRARGRLLAITGVDGKSLTARVLRAGETEVDLLTGRSGVEPLTLGYGAIAKARVEVEFSAPSAAVLALLGPETAGKFDRADVEADEIDEDEAGDEPGEVDEDELDEDQQDDEEDEEER